MSNLQYMGQLSLESFNQQVIQATIEKCAKTHNPRILEAIKESWIENLNKRLNSVKKGVEPQPAKLSKSVRAFMEEHKETELVSDNFTRKPQTSDDDEFLDADVVTATQPSQPSTKPESLTQKTEDTTEDKEGASSQKATKEASSDPDSDLSISEISDLDDEEPETNDLIIGMLEKVTRPSSKKIGPPLWKVKLKYGIMQLNNVEIPFDTLEGEFEF